jgi:hypothetical protein
MRLAVLASLVLITGGTASADEHVDLAAIHRIKQEAFSGSRVMDHLFYLTDVNGPRLTVSPGYDTAARWAVSRLEGYGVTARVEPWGAFGRSWSLVRYAAHMREPVYAPLGGVAKAWCGGTQGPVVAEVVSAPLYIRKQARDWRDLEKRADMIRIYIAAQKGKLKGKIVLLDSPFELEPPTQAPSERLDDAKLTALAAAPDPYPMPTYEWPLQRLPEDQTKAEQLLDSVPEEVGEDYFIRLNQARDPLNAFLRDEGVVGVLTTDTRGGGSIVFSEAGGAFAAGAPLPPPVVVLPPEPYLRLSRLVQHGIKTSVELEVGIDLKDEPKQAANVIGEITGGKKKDEVVMLGAHLDSWHAGTGATDNAAGCAVAIEAMRILKALGLPLDRSVRLALWSGEEQGLFGSRAYVREHFADPMTMAVKPEHGKLAGYFNLDNGTGKIRGVYLQGNDMVRPIFEAWLAPFRDYGATTLTIRDTDGTDHLAFDAVGLPGFQFIQDPLDYSSRTHHSSLDVYDHLVPADLMQASAILASFVYQAATRPEMLPRKPLPKPVPPKKS